MDENTLQSYGRCPLGHNLQPQGDTGDNLSTNEIDEGEEQPLFWSNYHQKYVCKMHLRWQGDLIIDEKKHQDSIDLGKKLDGMGFVTTSEGNQ